MLLCASAAASAQTTTRPVAPAGTAIRSSPAAKEIKAESPAAQAPSPAEPAAEMTSVTVSAERPTNRIDRQVYDVQSDVASSNASVADALAKVPSVTVDADGSVTLRGNANVQIMVDGKPAAALQGENRGAALNAMMADSVESIEVINNPGAEFGNDGGGGPILNLVSRRNRKPGGYAIVSGNGGNEGRYNGSTSGSYNEGFWGFQGNMYGRRDGRSSSRDTIRDRISPTTGERSHTVQSSRSEGMTDSAGFNGSASYNLGARDTLQANLSYSKRSGDNRSTGNYLSTNGAMATISEYSRQDTRRSEGSNYSWGARMEHKGAADGELFKLDLRVSGSDNDNRSDYRNAYVVRPRGASAANARQTSLSDNRIADLSGDYQRPFGQAMLKLGFKTVSNSSDIDARYIDIDDRTQAEILNRQRSNHFQFDERIYALYGSWQMRLNERWGVMAGLRSEYTDLSMHQITSAISAGNNYINHIPSAFATYKLSDDATLRLAYAHRLRRPGAYELNPFVIYGDEFNISSGNPRLKPTRTDSFELGYESRLFGLATNVRAYHRQERDAILERKYFISDTVLLSTRDNGPGSQSSGLEFTLSGKLTPKLNLNTSGNLARSEQRILDQTGINNQRSATSLSGQLTLDYQATPDDRWQVALHTRGRTLTGLGYREPSTTVNFTARHQLTPRLNLILNVRDIFNGDKAETYTDTSTLREQSLQRNDGRMAYLGFSYRYGGPNPPQRRPDAGPVRQINLPGGTRPPA